MSDRIQSFREEMVNTATHGLGVVFALVAMPFLIFTTAGNGSSKAVWAVSVFGFGMLMSYLSSTIYHAVQQPGVKRMLRIWDHISIFLLIGGTYTAVVQKFIPRETASTFLWVMWSIIGIGSVLKLFFTGKFKVIELALYIGLGWMAVFILDPLMAHMPLKIFWWILAGGLCYTTGVIFYVWKKLPFQHGIWHIFVLGGTVTHYVAVFKSTLLPLQLP